MKWDALSKAEQEERSDLQQEMNRLAFTKHALLDVFFSFCRSDDGVWEADSHTWHCRVCGECNDWRTCSLEVEAFPYGFSSVSRQIAGDNHRR